MNYNLTALDISLVDPITLLFLFKIALVIGLSIYTLFSLVTVRQTVLLGGTLKTDVNPFFKIISLMNLAASTFLLLFTIFVL